MLSQRVSVVNDSQFGRPRCPGEQEGEANSASEGSGKPKRALFALAALLVGAIAASGGPAQAQPAAGDLKPLELFLPEPGSWALLPKSTIEPATERAKTSLSSDMCGYIKCTSWSDVFTAWNGVAFDGRQIWALANGGHAGYGGNEVYRFDLRTPEAGWSLELPPQPLTGAFSRDEDGDGVKDACPTPASGPMSSHTYNGVIWSPRSRDIFWLGTVGFCRDGMGPATAWVFDPADKKWAERPDLDKLAHFARTEIDPSNGDIIVVGKEHVYLLDPGGKQIKRRSARGTRIYGGGLAFDARSRTLYATAKNAIYSTNISETGTFSGLAKFADVPGVKPAMGFALHAPTGDFILWDGGERTYRWRPGATELEDLPVTSEVPKSKVRNRVYSQWKYVPELDVFFGIVAKEGIWLYRVPTGASTGAGLRAATTASSGEDVGEAELATEQTSDPVPVAAGTAATSEARKLEPPVDSGPSADTSFEDLCARPETLLCDPLDKGEISGPGVTTDTPFKTLPEALGAPYGSWRIGVDKAALSSRTLAKSYHPPELDQSVFASGNGSIRFTVESQSGAGASSRYEITLSDNRPMGIRQGETMRVRFKARWSCDMLFTDCDPKSGGYQKERRRFAVKYGPGGFKILGIGQEDYFEPSGRRILVDKVPEMTAIVLGNLMQRGTPAVYLSKPWETQVWKGGNKISGIRQWDTQPGGDQPCWLNDPQTGHRLKIAPEGCFLLQADEWMTFQVDLSYGACTMNPKDPERASHLRLWGAREGQPFELVIDSAINIRCAPKFEDAARFGRVSLIPFHTAKDPSEVHPTGYIWYDDLWVAKVD